MSFGGGDEAPPARDLPPPPTMDEINSFLNKVTGIQSVKVKKPDGSFEIVTEKMPQTDDEKKIASHLGSVMKKSFESINQLIDTDPGKTVDYSPFIKILANVSNERSSDMSALTNIPNFTEYADQFEKRGAEVLEREFRARGNEQEAMLASRGLGKSSESIAMRNSLFGQRAESLAKNKESASLRAYEERNKFLEDSANVYKTKELERRGRLENAEATANLENKSISDETANRQRKLQNQSGLFDLTDKIAYRQKKDDATYASVGEQNLLNASNQTNNNRLQRYGIESGNILHQNQQDLERFATRDQSPGFGQMALGALGTLGGQALAPVTAGFGQHISQKLFSGGEKK
jgi:hypothetical protein